MSPYRIDEAYEILAGLEAKVDITELSHKGYLVWPVIRARLWDELLNNHDRQNSLRQHLRKPTLALRRLVPQIPKSRLERDSAHEAQFVAISRNAHLQRTPLGLSPRDRVLGPWIDDVREKSMVYVYGGSRLSRNPEASAPIPKPGWSLGTSQFRWANLRPELVRICGTTAKLNQTFALLEDSLWSFRRGLSIGEKILSASPNSNSLLNTVWYDTTTQGITARCQEFGWEVHDIQHGKQGRNNAMYSQWGFLSEGTFHSVPTVFHFWGSPSFTLFMETQPNQSSVRGVISGYPWLQFGLEASRGERNLVKMPTLLYTLQPPQALNQNRLPGFLSDLIHGDPVGLHVIIRGHPNDVGGFNQLQEDVESSSFQNLSFSSPEENLLDVLSQSTHHITAYSSVVYEDASMGIPSLVFGEDARVIFRDEIELGQVTWSQGDVGDVLKWIAAPVHTHALPNYFANDSTTRINGINAIYKRGSPKIT